jgi:cyclopropane fatty-acyl-phospholipid synthase-like methyltransferase
MRSITRVILKQIPLPAAPIVELGCGAGSMVARLQSDYPDHCVCGLELSSLALGHAQSDRIRARNLIQADLQRLPFVDDSAGTIIALDVFDQYGVELTSALDESRRVLQKDGILLVRVSAHPQLAGSHDHAFNTAQRHTRRSITSALERAGFAPIRTTYANALLSIPVATMRLLQRHSLTRLRETDYTHVWADRLLATMLEWEADWLSRHDLPFGLSLFVLACVDKTPLSPIRKEQPHQPGFNAQRTIG